MFSSDTLSDNIRKRRRALGLSQTELASRLGVSVQAISKWERGLCLPEISTLYELSRIFSVTVDELIDDTNPSGDKVFLAIDGGGTKTEFVLFTPNGRIMGRKLLPSTNPNTVGMERTLSVLKEGIDGLLSLSKLKVLGIYAGIAGMLSGRNADTVLAFLKERYPCIPSLVSTDIYNVIYSASERERCLLAIAGTGTIVYAKTGEDIHRFGGWGYLLDEGGSGYNLGCGALRAVLRENEGTGEKTILKPLVESKIGGDIFSKITELYDGAPASIASLAPLVFTAAKADDKAAIEIIRNSTAHLAKSIMNAREQYGTGNTVIISGGLLSERDIWLPMLKEALDFTPEIIVPSLPQIFGAARRAAALFGNGESLSEEKFTEEYSRILKEV